MRKPLLALFFLALGISVSGCVTTAGAGDRGEPFASDDDFRSWFAFYYKAPHPERVTESLRYMKKHAYLDDYPDIASVFLAQVMTANPESIDGWVSRDWQDLGGSEWSVILVSLWMVDTEQSRSLMAQHADRADASYRERIKGLQTRSPTLIDPLTADVADPRQVNLVWAAFSATGDERYVRKIIDLVHHYGEVTDQTHAAIGEAAIMTLANNALQHDIVAKLCDRMDSAHPDPKTRILLKAMLNALADVAKNEGNLPAH